MGSSRKGCGGDSALLVDLYELTMAQAYYAEGLDSREATFSLFARSLPPGWGYLIAAGLDDVLEFLAAFSFGDEEIAYLDTLGLFSDDFLEYLRDVRFTGDVRAMPEGTLFFPSEPPVEVTAPVLEAQLVETGVLNRVHFQSLVAAKAGRCVDAANGRRLVDFGLRRTHGTDAGLKAARSAFVAGFDATSNVLAGKRYGIPVAGTMAHSFVQCFGDEAQAFRAFARAFPDQSVLLVDTYDTPGGALRAAEVGAELAARGHRLRGIRLDSGDLLELSRETRAILDQGGSREATIFASGGLDEREIERLVDANAPVDAFGVGSRLGTSGDAPYLDMAYKLVYFDGKPRLKLSQGKATWPGCKQVWRVMSEANGAFGFDVLGLADEEGPPGARPLLQSVMRAGRRTHAETVEDSRWRAGEERRRLPPAHRRLDAAPYPVTVSEALRELRESVTAEIKQAHGIG